MKVLQVGYLNPYSDYGGVERYILNLVTSLNRKYGIKSDIICVASENSRKSMNFGDVVFLKAPLRISGLFFLSKYFYSIHVRKYLQKNASKYDVLHFHGDNGLISKKLKVKSILTLHGVARNTSSIVRHFISSLSFHIEKNNVRNAGRIFSISVEACVVFKRYTNTDLKLIKQSIDTEFYTPVSNQKKISIRESLGIPQDFIVGVITGRDPLRKGLKIAINAIKSVNREKILLIAIGFPQVKPNEEKVRFTGDIDEATKLRYLQSADFFIFPSLKEGFPISVLEAASVGLPLIVSKSSSVSELKICVPYFKEVDSLEPKEYSKVIDNFIEYYPANKGRDLNSRTDFISEYSISNTADLYFKAYSEIMNNV